MRKIFHIDVNSAYLSWEAAYALQHGASLDLRSVPSIVGGDIKKRRGIVLAKSIPAKAYGIKTGEPVVSALSKCPNLISIPPHYERYMVASKSLVDLVSSYSPKIQRFSIDEMFMDFDSNDIDPIDQANEIRERAKNELGFTVNIGIGDNKLLAKMASDFQKPDRVHTLYKSEIKKKMWPLPIGDLFMVGRKTEKKLKSRGIFTIGDLANLDGDYIKNWLKKPGYMIWEFANGIENTEVREEKSPIKSIGNSTTIAFDVEKKQEALMIILGLCEMVSSRLRELSMRAGLIHVGFKNSDFKSFGMERKIYTSINSTKAIYEKAAGIFDLIWDKSPIRQISVRAGKLIDDTSTQLSLFDCLNEDEEALDKAIDKIRKKYGLKSIQRSVFLNSGISPVIGGVMEEVKYPMMSSQLT